jgi:hypothetical protein
MHKQPSPSPKKLSALLWAVAWMAGACASPGSTTGGTGGASASGGTTATGGATGSGGSGTGGASTGSGGNGSGGAPSSGGTGGTVSTGGATGSGGSASTGGTTGAGGAAGARGGAGGSAQGGATGSGGLAGAGGRAGAGGVGGGGGKGGASGAGGAAASCTAPSTYDQTVLCDQPVAYWAMAMKASGSTEPDLVGSNNGTYKGTAPTTTALPNGDAAAHFNGTNGYLTIPSNANLSVPTTHTLTWEGWIYADTLQFPNNTGGYVDWMGKCADYSPTCEWEARMYTTTNSESRPNRMSAYIFNPSAGLGSAADWQPVDNLIKAGNWYYVVGEYTTLTAPSDCQNTAMYPGAINVWVNGVEWNHSQHGQTGCMSQYNVVPAANNSPLNIGTMAQDAWFPGAVGKVAVYDKLLTQAQITAHYKAMTGQTPTGSCSATCSF